MSIPDYETVMLPLMQFAAGGKEYSINEVTTHLADLFKLTPEEREQRIPSGQSSYIQNRTGWAKSWSFKLTKKRSDSDYRSRQRSAVAEARTH